MSSATQLLVALALSLLGATFTAEAQPAKLARVGMLMPVSSAAAAPNIEAFRQGLRERGYVEGQTVAIESRFAEAKFDRLPDFAAELVSLRVDVIVTWGTVAADAAKRATSTIPIVMAAATDPVGSGLIASLARPGGNVTGLTAGTWELSGKSLELLKELVPRVARVAILMAGSHPINHPRILPERQAAARTLKLQLQIPEVRDVGELESALAAMAHERVGALFVIHGVVHFQYRHRLVDLAAKNRLPAMYERREYVDAGGLMSYGVNFRDNFRRAAGYVDRILKSAKPGDLAVEHPRTFELVVNLKTARALGLTIPESLQLRADEIIR